VPSNIVVLTFPEQCSIHTANDLAIPSMVDILKMSKNDKVYKWFLASFLKHGVGARNWNQKHLRFPLSKYCTPSTEAIVLLIIENGYDRWLDKASNKDKKRADLAVAKFTNSGISQKGGQATSRQGGGWSSDGIHRFNELVAWVKMDRQTRGPFEHALMKQLNDDNTVKTWMQSKTSSLENIVEEVVAVDDFDEEDELESTNDLPVEL
jgi:hypothetical protein